MVSVSADVKQSEPSGIATCDALTGAVAGYGLRRLSANYRGFAFRVRRSGDNAERDIYFRQDGAIDIDSYRDFVGTSSAFCSVLYDQIGTRNIVQTTTGLQPDILLIDGEYVLRFTGGDFLQAPSFVGGLGGTFTAHVAWRAPNTVPSGYLSQMGGFDWDAGQNFFSPWWTTIQHGSFYSNAVATNANASWEDGKWRQMTLKYSGGAVSLFEFGTQIMDPTTRVEPNWARFTLGKNDFGNGDFYFSEFVLWPRDIPAQTVYRSFRENHPTLLATSSERLFVFLGDSNTTTLYGGLGRTWSKIAGDAAGLNRWHTFCLGGWTIQNVFDRRAAWSLYASNIKRAQSTLVVFLGTNDLAVDGITADAALLRLKNLCRHAKSNGYNRTVVITPLPRFQTGTGQNLSFEPRRQALSNAMIADKSGDFDVVVDVRTLAIGVDGNQDLATNYVGDFVHLNTTGQAILGNAVALVL